MTRASIAVALALLATSAAAMDRGQFDGVDPDVRAWFRAQKSRSGVPCCDIADGHRTTWRSGAGGYEVPIAGEWIAVPDEAVIYNANNPTGEAVVWYGHVAGKPWIRCFVPGDGA